MSLVLKFLVDSIYIVSMTFYTITQFVSKTEWHHTITYLHHNITNSYYTLKKLQGCPHRVCYHLWGLLWKWVWLYYYYYLVKICDEIDNPEQLKIKLLELMSQRTSWCQENHILVESPCQDMLRCVPLISALYSVKTMEITLVSVAM